MPLGTYIFLAWTMSGEKYGRAMRQLARLEFDREDMENATKHMSMGLAQSHFVFRLVSSGFDLLKIETLSRYLGTVSTCGSSAGEDANAWANLATHARLNGFDQAYSA